MAGEQIETGEYEGGDQRNPPNELLQLSIAISLKRIADTVEGGGGRIGLVGSVMSLARSLWTHA